MEISKVYAENHLNMVEMSEPGKTCDPPWDDFQEGIVNGAYWYIIKGGMQVILVYIIDKLLQALLHLNKSSIGVCPVHPPTATTTHLNFT